MAGVRVRPLECGWLTSDAGGMIQGQRGVMRMPVAAFLIEHPDGTAVFDTGMHPELATTTARMRSTADLFQVEQTEEWTLAGQLAATGVAPDDVGVAVVSHLHFDHCGGLGQLPDARLVVQRAEWEAAFDEGLVEFGVFNPDDFDLGHDRQLADGEVDVFGDGAVRLLPTAGHTAGHQSMLVEERLLLVGDACYCRLALDLDALPPFAADHERQRATFGWLRDQEAAGVDLVFSHDAAQWAALPPTL